MNLSQIIMGVEESARQFEASDKGIVAAQKFASELAGYGEQMLRLAGRVRRGEPQ